MSGHSVLDRQSLAFLVSVWSIPLLIVMRDEQDVYHIPLIQAVVVAITWDNDDMRSDEMECSAFARLRVSNNRKGTPRIAAGYNSFSKVVDNLDFSSSLVDINIYSCIV